MSLEHVRRVWSGDWRSRVKDRVRQKGFESVVDFVSAHPRVSFFHLAKILGEDIAECQLREVYFSKVCELGCVRYASMDALVRELRSELKTGWGRGENSEFHAASAFASWESMCGCHDIAGIDAIKQRVWFKIKDLKPPEGWLPESKDDPLIKAAFDEAWPVETDDSEK